MASMTKREMVEYEQDIALSLDYTRTCLAMCDEIIASIEHVYVTGIPAAQAEIYRDGLESRAEAIALSQSLYGADVIDAHEMSSDMEEAMRRAAVFLSTVEHSLFPEQRLRKLPKVPGVEAEQVAPVKDRYGRPLLVGAAAFVVFLLIGLGMGYAIAGGVYPGMFLYGGTVALLAGGMAYRIARG